MAKECVKCASDTKGAPVVHETCYDEECKEWQQSVEELERVIEDLEDRRIYIDPFDQLLAELRQERLPNYAER
jgi:hypothetical protein